MTREELTAIVAGIIQGVAIQGAIQCKGAVDLKGLTIECVDAAEGIVSEAAKPPEQRAEERTARAVAAKMTEAEQAKDEASSGADFNAAELKQAQDVMAWKMAGLQNANSPFLAAPPIRTRVGPKKSWF